MQFWVIISFYLDLTIDICTLKIFTNDIHDLATVIMDTRLPHLSSFFGGQTKNDLFPILDNNV